MSRSRPRQGFAYAGLAGAMWPHLTTAGMVASAVLPLLLIAAVAPAGLVLPIASVAFLAVAAVLALVAWRVRTKRHADKLTIWDVCGACAFIGFAAAILSKPENVLIAFTPALGG